MVTRVLAKTEGRDRYVGMTDDNERFYVSVIVEHTEGEGRLWETIEHDVIGAYWNVRIMGSLFEKRGSRWECAVGGQIREYVSRVNWREAALSSDHLKTLDGLWRDFHGATLHAGCVHHSIPNRLHVPSAQYEGAINVNQYRCPNGYRWGSKWLIKPIPDEAIARAIDLVSAINATKEAPYGW